MEYALVIELCSCCYVFLICEPDSPGNESFEEVPKGFAMPTLRVQTLTMKPNGPIAFENVSALCTLACVPFVDRLAFWSRCEIG